MIWTIDWQSLLPKVQDNQVPILSGIVLIWVVYGLNIAFEQRINQTLGLVPRTVPGLAGIVCAPCLHGHTDHLFFNTFALYILAHFIALSGWDHLYQATVFIVLVSGSILWLIGRKAIHIGASGLIMGYFGMILAQAYQQPSLLGLILVFLCLSYLGGLVSSLFDFKKGISWEAHLLGFLSGILFTYFQFIKP